MQLKTLLNKVNQNYTEKTAEQLKDYKYIVKSNDAMLSGWGGSGSRGHCQLVLCKDRNTADKIINGMENDGGLNYINWHYTTQLILNSKKTYSLNIAESCCAWNK